MGNSSCPIEHKPSDPRPFLDDGNLNFSAHDVGWIVAGCFSMIAIVISFWLIHKHLIFYTKPNQQRHIVRILFMVPIYSVTSFGSYLFWTEAIYWQLIRAVYEAFTIHSFFYLLISLVANDEEEVKMVFQKVEIDGWLFPLGSVKYRPKSGMDFLWLMKWCILQYTVLGPLCGAIAVVTQYMGIYCLGSWGPGFTHIYMVAIISISVSVAMYCVIQLYWPLRNQMAPFKPVLKLLSIKAIVFLMFWQDVGVGLFATFGILKESEYWTAEQIEVGISAILTCFEMTLFSLLHVKAFTYLPYRARAAHKPLPDGLKTWDDDVPESLRRERTSILHALEDILNPTDMLREIFKGGTYMRRKAKGLDGEVDRADDLEIITGRRRKIFDRKNDLAEEWYDDDESDVASKNEVEKLTQRLPRPDFFGDQQSLYPMPSPTRGYEHLARGPSQQSASRYGHDRSRSPSVWWAPKGILDVTSWLSRERQHTLLSTHDDDVVQYNPHAPPIPPTTTYTTPYDYVPANPMVVQTVNSHRQGYQYHAVAEDRALGQSHSNHHHFNNHSEPNFQPYASPYPASPLQMLFPPHLYSSPDLQVPEKPRYAPAGHADPTSQHRDRVSDQRLPQSYVPIPSPIPVSSSTTPRRYTIDSNMDSAPRNVFLEPSRMSRSMSTDATSNMSGRVSLPRHDLPPLQASDGMSRRSSGRSVLELVHYFDEPPASSCESKSRSSDQSQKLSNPPASSSNHQYIRDPYQSPTMNTKSAKSSGPKHPNLQTNRKPTSTSKIPTLSLPPPSHQSQVHRPSQQRYYQSPQPPPNQQEPPRLIASTPQPHQYNRRSSIGDVAATPPLPPLGSRRSSTSYPEVVPPVPIPHTKTSRDTGRHRHSVKAPSQPMRSKPEDPSGFVILDESSVVEEWRNLVETLPRQSNSKHHSITDLTNAPRTSRHQHEQQQQQHLVRSRTLNPQHHEHYHSNSQHQQLQQQYLSGSQNSKLVMPSNRFQLEEI